VLIDFVPQIGIFHFLLIDLATQSRVPSKTVVNNALNSTDLTEV
jgi:hypothetical protein